MLEARLRRSMCQGFVHGAPTPSRFHDQVSGIVVVPAGVVDVGVPVVGVLVVVGVEVVGVVEVGAAGAVVFLIT
jgi:hypothetical protein